MTIDVTLLNRFSLNFCYGNEKQDICYCNFYNEFATKVKFMISTDNRVGHLETGFYFFISPGWKRKQLKPQKLFYYK